MAVAHDASVQAAGNGVNSLALPALTTAGTNELLLCITHVSSTATISSISGGAITFTKLGSTVTLAGNGQIEMWYAFASSALSSQVLTISNSGGFPQMTAVISAYSGVDTTGTNGLGAIGATNTANTGGAASISASVTTTRANSLVTAGAGHTGSNAMTAGTSQTLNTTTPTTSGFSIAGMERQNATTSSSGTSVTGSMNLAAAGAFGIFVVEVLPPAAPTSIPNKAYQLRQAINRAASF